MNSPIFFFFESLNPDKIGVEIRYVRTYYFIYYFM